MDTLAHQLLLLELDDHTGTSRLPNGTVRHLALAGALVAELQLRDRLVPVAADRFGVAAGVSELPVLAEAERLLPDQPQSVKRCIYRLHRYGRRLRRMVLDELVEAGALRVEQDKVWRVPYRTRWPTAAPGLEATLVEHLRSWVRTVGRQDPPDRPDLLLSLARSVKLLDAVWSGAELEALQPILAERTARAPIGRVVREHIMELGAAPMRETAPFGRRG